MYDIYIGCNIQRLTDVNIEPVQGAQQCVAEKTAMVRAARQLLSAITKVLILADKVVVKQVLAAKDKVSTLWLPQVRFLLYRCTMCLQTFCTVRKVSNSLSKHIIHTSTEHHYAN